MTNSWPGPWFGRDFVTGFHKRKKKRRKEAQKILQEKARKKKIQDRKRVRNTLLSLTHTEAV